ncbi:MAG: LPS assembly lipoprotein LptE [Gammaproteobacteria bacterium]
MLSFSLRAALILVLVSIVTACGFRLRGTESFPLAMSETYLAAADRFSPFYRQLSRELDSHGLKIVSSPASAGAVIKIQEDSSGQRVSAVSARNIPQEYDVYYIVQYSVSIEGQEVLATQRLARSQVYDFDSTEILGKSREEQVLTEALADDLVKQVVVQLVTLKK